ncbi:MAG: 50S ribosomal protein L25 [bacterium]|nr:50S ribosomal protein L25 [bacterium]
MSSATIELKVMPRPGVGGGAARKVRQQGLVPAVVYGHGQTFPISFSPKEFHDALGSHSPTSVLFTLKGAGSKSVTARIRDFQLDVLNGRRVLHADFQIVTRDEAVRASVAVVTVGVAKGVKDFGGILDVLLHDIEIEAPAAQVPESLEIDVTALGIGDHVTVSELKLPKGVKVLASPETAIVAVEASKIERALAEAEVAAAAPAVEQQPEVITRGKEGEAE